MDSSIWQQRWSSKKIEIENFFADYKKIFSKKVYSVKYVFNNMNKNCISVYDLKN